jgi:hypothetical protein
MQRQPGRVIGEQGCHERTSKDKCLRPGELTVLVSHCLSQADAPPQLQGGHRLVLLLLLRACLLHVLQAAVQHLRVLRQGRCRQLQVGSCKVGASLPQRAHPGVQAHCTGCRRCSPCSRAAAVSQHRMLGAEVVLRIAVETYSGSMNSKCPNHLTPLWHNQGA